MFRLRRKGRGPLEGNRLVDTPEVKVDQLFTRKDEKLVAICVTMSRDAAMKIGAEGYVGLTRIGGRGEYEKGKEWVTRILWIPDNIPGGRLMGDFSSEVIRNSLMMGGTIVPNSVPLEKVEERETILLPSSATLIVDRSGSVTLIGLKKKIQKRGR